jgi:hypothetical protein
VDDDRVVFYLCLPSATGHTTSMRLRSRGSNMALAPGFPTG